MNIDVSSKMDSKHKEFIDQFVQKIKNIILHRDMDYSAASGFDVDYGQVQQLYSDIDQEIHEVLRHASGKRMDG